MEEQIKKDEEAKKELKAEITKRDKEYQALNDRFKKLEDENLEFSGIRDKW